MSLIIPGAGCSLDHTTIEILRQLPFSGDAPWRPENKSTALGLAGVSGLPCPRCADVAAYGFKADFAYSPKGLKLAVADLSCRSSLMSRFWGQCGRCLQPTIQRSSDGTSRRLFRTHLNFCDARFNWKISPGWRLQASGALLKTLQAHIPIDKKAFLP
jgi:hypothetical protein